MYYSIVNPRSQAFLDDLDTAYVSHSASPTFASIMYAHYLNLVKILSLQPFTHIETQPVVWCASNLYGDAIRKMTQLPEPQVESRTVYHSWPTVHQWRHKNGLPMGYDLHLLYGNLHSMTRFTQAYKQFEGDKLVLLKTEHAITGKYYKGEDMETPMKNILALDVHKWSMTNIEMKASDVRLVEIH